MCGRYAFTMLFDEVAEFFKLAGGQAWIDSPRYNIAPSQDVSVVRVAEGTVGLREMVAMHWGLIPSWSKDAAGGARMINARSETAATNHPTR